MKKQKEQFRTARRVFNTSRKTVPTMCIEGCCYGNDNKEYNDSDHEKYCGEKFWTLISGEPTLFVDILTSSLRTPKILVKEFCYFLMPIHQHGLCIDILVQR